VEYDYSKDWAANGNAVLITKTCKKSSKNEEKGKNHDSKPSFGLFCVGWNES
jgi:hypothetical protein